MEENKDILEEDKEVKSPKKKGPELTEEYSYVIYTDGSGDNMSKTWGCGFIGYGFDMGTVGFEDKSPLKKLKPSTLGFMSDELLSQDVQFYTHAKHVRVKHVITGYYPGNHPNTNNYGEAKACLESLKCLVQNTKEHKVKSILFKSDSQMLIQVLTSLLKDPNVDVSRYAYPELYKQVLDIFNILKSNGTLIVCKHVYGHSGSLGNHIADRLALVARSKQELSLSSPEYKDVNIPSIHFRDVDNFKEEIKDIKKTFIGNNFHKFYTFVNPVEGIRPFYVLEYDKDEEPGERNGDIISGTVMEETKDDKIESVIEEICKKPRDCVLYSLDLDNLKSSLVEYFYNIFGKDILTSINAHGAIRLMEDIDLAVPIRPGGLLVQMMDKTFHRETILDIYKKWLETGKEPKDMGIKDVTDKFFGLVHDPKKKKDINKFILEKDEVTIPMKVDGVTSDRLLLLRHSIPNKNFFKKFEGDTEIKCTLISQLVHMSENKKDKSITYSYDDYFILDTKLEDGSKSISIWNNVYSGKTITTIKNKNK